MGEELRVEGEREFGGCRTVQGRVGVRSQDKGPSSRGFREAATHGCCGRMGICVWWMA